MEVPIDGVVQSIQKSAVILRLCRPTTTWNLLLIRLPGLPVGIHIHAYLRTRWARHRQIAMTEVTEVASASLQGGDEHPSAMRGHEFTVAVLRALGEQDR